jgi:hypothetical protein
MASELREKVNIHMRLRGFRKIRYMGFLASRGKAQRLAKIRAALKTEPPENPHKDETLRERILRRTGADIALCPFCEKGHMEHTGVEIPPKTCRPP